MVFVCEPDKNSLINPKKELEYFSLTNQCNNKQCNECAIRVDWGTKIIQERIFKKHPKSIV